MTNVNITGNYYVGALVGLVDNINGEIDGSTISNCYSTGSVEGTGRYVGGLAGWVRDTSTVSNCYSTSSVEGTDRHVGGLAGLVQDNSTISNCYSTGSVSGNN